MALHRTAGLLLARSLLQCTAGAACAQHDTALKEQEALLRVRCMSCTSSLRRSSAFSIWATIHNLTFEAYYLWFRLSPAL